MITEMLVREWIKERAAYLDAGFARLQALEAAIQAGGGWKCQTLAAKARVAQQSRPRAKAPRPPCPDCGSSRVWLYGSKAAVQYYLCPVCSKQFSANSGKGNVCPIGHEMTESNTHMDKRGGRHCRTCDRMRKRAAYWGSVNPQQKSLAIPGNA